MMKRRILISTILAIVALGAGACSQVKEKTSGDTTVSSKEAATGEAGVGALAQESQAAAPEGSLPEGNQEGQAEDDLAGGTSRPEENTPKELIGIKAHVKEINGSQLLVSSDSEDYPGVFAVDGAEEPEELSRLQGGTVAYILMQDLGEDDSQGIPKFRAERILPLAGDEDLGQEDILLTEVPLFQLQDALSSKNGFTELRSGNYSWNVEDGGEGSGVIACGTAPLEQAGMESAVRLKLPEYQGLGGVPYLFSTKAAPDILIVTRWDDAQIGNVAAEEELIIKYYYSSPVLELEPGKVYEFSAGWKKKNVDKNKFYGNATYVLVTE